MDRETMRDRAIQAISSAVDSFNDGQPEDARVTKTTTTPLFGEGATLDSIGLVNLIVAVEQGVEAELGVPIILANDRALSQKNNPFSTIETLTDYVILLLKENPNA